MEVLFHLHFLTVVLLMNIINKGFFIYDFIIFLIAITLLFMISFVLISGLQIKKDLFFEKLVYSEKMISITGDINSLIKFNDFTKHVSSHSIDLNLIIKNKLFFTKKPCIIVEKYNKTANELYIISRLIVIGKYPFVRVCKYVLK